MGESKIDETEETSCHTSVKRYFKEYCNATGIHGFRYFGEDRSYFERVWWFVVFTVMLVGMIASINAVYEKWIQSPVIVSFATKGTPIYSIPFPAITICPQSKTQQSLYNHTKIIRKYVDDESLTEEEQKLLDYMGLFCDDRSMLTPNYTNAPFIEDAEDFFKTLDTLKPKTIFRKCHYMGRKVNCENLFKPILTDEGICYSFNMLDKSEIFADSVYHYSDFFQVPHLSHGNWTMEDGYTARAGIRTYPRRALLSGVGNALVAELYTSTDDIDFNCKNGIQGFRVSLHIPTRVPRTNQHYFMVPLDQTVLADVKPDMMTTSESVQVFNPAKRECYFRAERKLKYFKIYSSLNCKIECLTNYTLSTCGCVNFFMPREKETKICAVGKLDCMKKAERSMEMKELVKNFKNEAAMSNNNDNDTTVFTGDLPECNCLPICTDIIYDAQISQNKWDWFEEFKAYMKDDEFEYEKDKHHLSKLVLFFKNAQFINSERHELYGPIDFLANFGGLLGLFMGFSALSLMEIIYFLSVRICCNNKLYGYWAGPNPVKETNIQLTKI